MADDYGSRYSSAYPFPLSANGSRLYSGSLNGTIGPEDTTDEDWFKVFLQKGATYEFKLTGGSEVYDLNGGILRWNNKSNSYIASEYWDSDYSSDDGKIITTPISSTGNYYLQVDLYGGALDTGSYSLAVEQLTEGIVSHLTQSLSTSMNDDYGSRYTTSKTFPLITSNDFLDSGSINGVIGPEDTTDEDWFKVFLQKGATYEFKLTAGSEVYDLNGGVLRWNNKSNSYIASEYWDSDYSSDDGKIVTTPISSTGNYYLQVDLYGGDLDVGAYTLEVEQLTKGFTTHLTNTSQTTMTDDFGSRYTNAHTFPLIVGSDGLASGMIAGTIGPEDTTDEDWFKVYLLKGATYEFKLTGGSEVYDLNGGVLRWNNKSNSYIASEYWDSDYSSDDGTIITTPISASGNYYLQVDLYGGDLDVGAYTLEVEQLTPGFGAASPTPSPTPTPTPAATSAPLPTPSPSQSPTVINNYYTTNNSTNTSNNTNNNTNVTINNTGNGDIKTGSIGTVNNTTMIDNSFNIQTISINLSIAITGDSKKSEKVEGTDGDDLIADGLGKDKLIGGEGADQFYFSGEEPFRKKTVDKVIDFNPSEGDTIVVADEVVGDPREDPTLAIADTKKEFKQLAKDGYDLLYLEPKGDLFVDGNGDAKGFGKKTVGGQIADLPKYTVLTEDDILVGE